MSLDDNDVNILHVLQDNGRLSFRQVSEKVKISVPTVSNKVGNIPARQVNAQHARTPCTSHPTTFYFKA
jgi:DNA-binding Lrp family transcriptional regulator